MTLNPFRWRLSEWKGFRGKVRINLHREYIGQGKAVFGFLWGFIALFGIASRDVKTTLIMGILYYILAYFAGRYWLNHEWRDAENEVNNMFNPFVKEMRKHVKNKTFK